MKDGTKQVNNEYIIKVTIAQFDIIVYKKKQKQKNNEGY